MVMQNSILAAESFRILEVNNVCFAQISIRFNHSFKGMIKQIKEDYGFRVTLWIHPFVNLDCKSWLEAAIPPKSYFVRDTKGKKDDGVS